MLMSAMHPPKNPRYVCVHLLCIMNNLGAVSDIVDLVKKIFLANGNSKWCIT